MQLLECVNTCLSAMGEARVTSTAVRHPTVDLINSTITMKKRQYLERGWWFNVMDTTMYPATDGSMEYPVNALSIIGYCGETFVARDGKLFDMDEGTSIFTEPKKMRVFYDVAFEDLPECVANVVMYRTMREVYVGDLGSDPAVQNMQLNEQVNNATVETQHLRNKRFSTRQRSGWSRLQSALRN